MKELKKENVENLSYKDIANLIIDNAKKGMNTLELFTNIINILELISFILYLNSSIVYLLPLAIILLLSFIYI